MDQIVSNSWLIAAGRLMSLFGPVALAGVCSLIWGMHTEISATRQDIAGLQLRLGAVEVAVKDAGAASNAAAKDASDFRLKTSMDVTRLDTLMSAMRDALDRIERIARKSEGTLTERVGPS